MRKALNYAVDRTVVTNAAGFRAGKPTDQIIPPGLAGYRNASLYPTHANVARAKALLAGRTGKLTLYTSLGPPTEEQALIIASSLKRVGLDVTVKKFPFGVLLGRIGNPKEPYDMILIGWFADYADPYDFVDVLMNGNRIAPRNNLANLALFDDPKFNKQLDAAAKLIRRRALRRVRLARRADHARGGAVGADQQPERAGVRLEPHRVLRVRAGLPADEPRRRLHQVDQPCPGEAPVGAAPGRAEQARDLARGMSGPRPNGISID